MELSNDIVHRLEPIGLAVVLSISLICSVLSGLIKQHKHKVKQENLTKRFEAVLRAERVDIDKVNLAQLTEEPTLVKQIKDLFEIKGFTEVLSGSKEFALTLARYLLIGISIVLIAPVVVYGIDKIISSQGTVKELNATKSAVSLALHIVDANKIADLNAAIDNAKQLVLISPSFETYLTLAKLQDKVGDYPNAMQSYRKAEPYSRPTAAIENEIALCAMKCKDFPAAEKALGTAENLAATESASSNLRFRMAVNRVKLFLDEAGKAITDHDKQKGATLVDKALTSFSSTENFGIQKSTIEIAALESNFGRCLELIGRKEAAADHYRAADKANTFLLPDDYIQGKYNLGDALTRYDAGRSEGLVILGQLSSLLEAKKGPLVAPTYFAMGVAYLKLKDYAKARLNLNIAIEKSLDSDTKNTLAHTLAQKALSTIPAGH